MFGSGAGPLAANAAAGSSMAPALPPPVSPAPMASNPSNVISVDSLAKKGNTFQEKVVINRVEYADGTIWQRQDWSLKDVKNTYERALKETWVPGMCKNL